VFRSEGCRAEVVPKANDGDMVFLGDPETMFDVNDAGLIASLAGGPDHPGLSQYDTNGDGVLDSRDLAGLLGQKR